MSATSTAAAQVFDLPELLESILLQLNPTVVEIDGPPVLQLFTLQALSHVWCAIISTSKPLEDRMLRPQNTYEAEVHFKAAVENHVKRYEAFMERKVRYVTCPHYRLARENYVGQSDNVRLRSSQNKTGLWRRLKLIPINERPVLLMDLDSDAMRPWHSTAVILAISHAGMVISRLMRSRPAEM